MFADYLNSRSLLDLCLRCPTDLSGIRPPFFFCHSFSLPAALRILAAATFTVLPSVFSHCTLFSITHSHSMLVCHDNDRAVCRPFFFLDASILSRFQRTYELLEAASFQ